MYMYSLKKWHHSTVIKLQSNKPVVLKRCHFPLPAQFSMQYIRLRDPRPETLRTYKWNCTLSWLQPCKGPFCQNISQFLPEDPPGSSPDPTLRTTEIRDAPIYCILVSADICLVDCYLQILSWHSPLCPQLICICVVMHSSCTGYVGVLIIYSPPSWISR